MSIKKISTFVFFVFFTTYVGNVFAEKSIVFDSEKTIAAKVEPKWKKTIFKRNVYEEDIQILLKKIAELNKSQIIFGPGVKGTITFKFEEILLEEAFGIICDDNDLTYSWAGNILRVNALAKESKPVIVPLKYISAKEVKSVFKKYGLLKNKLNLKFDEVSNTVFMNAPQKDLTNYMSIIQSLEDVKKSQVGPDAGQKIEVIKLRYARVGSREISFLGEKITVPGVETLLKDILGIQRGEQKANDAQVGTTTNQSKTVYRTSTGSVAFDKLTNSILVKDYPDRITEIKEVIHMIDNEIPLVQIDVAIIDATLNFSRELGFQWGGTLNNTYTNGSLQLGGGTDGNLGTVSATNPLVNAGVLTPIGAVSGSFISGAQVLNGIIQAAENDADTQTLSNPRIVTLDNVESYIQSTRTDYVKTAAGANGNGDLKEITYGIVLRVTPHILYSEDDANKIEAIALNVVAENSGSNATSVDGTPIVTTQNMITQSVVTDGGTVILGGLYTNEASDTENKVPLLGDIPLLGLLFQNNKKVDNRREILFLISPRVVTERDLFAKMKNNFSDSNNGLLKDYRGTKPMLNEVKDPKIKNALEEADKILAQ